MVLFSFLFGFFFEEEDERIFEVLLLLLLIGMEDGIVWERGI